MTTAAKAGFGFPAIRGTARIDWEYRDFAIGAQANYNKGYSVLRDPTIACAASILAIQSDCHVSANVTHDVSILYSGIKNLSLSLVVQNIGDKRPPVDANARPVNFTYHPFRSAYATFGATYKFK